MGSISLPAISAFVSTYGGAIAAGASAVTAGVTAYESHEQGVAQANAAKQKARVEADQATQQQITQRQNMLRALASQNAGTLGAVGTGAGSSFAANAGRQISQAQNDLMVTKANSSAQTSLLDQQASNARAAGNIGAAADVFNGIAKNPAL
jgi:hypothetical protein